MTTEFKRENRYIVIKRTDLDKLYKDPTKYATTFGHALALINPHLPKRQFLVIESDWPEYEPVWQMIERRMTGQPQGDGEPVACMPTERCYDVRAKMIIAFNEAKKSGGDLDDALDAAYKSALRYSPNPMTAEQPAPVAAEPPAGPDRISMKDVMVFGNGGGNPVTYAANGLIVDLDGYALIAPGVEYKIIIPSGACDLRGKRHDDLALYVADKPIEPGSPGIEFVREEPVTVATDNTREIEARRLFSILAPGCKWHRTDDEIQERYRSVAFRPAAVVLPERMPNDESGEAFDGGWNAYDDELKSLNGIKT